MNNLVKIITLCLLEILNTSYIYAGKDDFIEKFTISSEFKKKILGSILKTNIRTSDGKKFIAYLYAEDEVRRHEKIPFCFSGEEISSISMEGHYYIYLYDVTAHSFLNTRTKIFTEFDGQTFNIAGADVAVLANHKKKMSDILLISQFGSCSGNFFEAYGFATNNSSLRNYYFLKEGNRNKEFFGFISPGYYSLQLDANTINPDYNYRLTLKQNNELNLKEIPWPDIR